MLGENSIELSDTTFQAKDEIKTNCTIPYQKYFLSLRYNGDNSYLFVNGVQQHKFQTKDSDIKPSKLYLGNITDQVPILDSGDNIYYFSVDYKSVTTEKIQDIHTYVMKKTTSHKMSQYFPPYTEPEFIKVDLDLNNCATQKDLNNLLVKTSDFALKANLAALKTKVENLKTKVENKT